MAESIDQLQIDINAQANRANKVIDTLCSKIDRLTVSMNRLDGSKLGVLANGVQRLGTAMQTMNNVKTADFTRLANNLSNLNKLDVSNISKLSASVNNIGTAFKSLSGVPESVKNITKLTDSISRLSSANVKGLENVDFSKIGNSINLLSNSLSNAPKIQQSIISMTNAVGNLAKSGDKIPLVSSSLGSLGTALNKFISDMSNDVNISDSTINFANAIGVLAKSGNTMPKTTSNLSALGVELKKLMKELSTAPKVSQNLIDMTNALAKLARTGSSSGKAANSLVSSFNRISKASSGMKINLLSAVNGISAIRKSILQAMGIAGGFYAVFQGIKESINIASDLTEVQNVVDVTFGNFKKKIEDLADVSIPELGMSELTTKNIASRFQAMGTAMGFTQGKMADMSVELTRLTGDMASFYNVEQDAVGEDLEAIFTGQTKPLRQYGLDLTEATLQEWAMKQGMDANINSMSQMEKTMLRYQYVMANTGAAQGDFIRTADTWANQIRVLKENFRALGSVIGTTFINALKPLVKALNSAMSHIIAFAKTVSNALGKIFGWKYEDTSGGVANDYADAADSADDLASGTGKAADNAKKLRQQLQGIDELNVLSSNQDTGSGGGSGSGGGATGGADASGGQWVKTDGILKDYESQLDTLYKLGEHIGNTLTNAMKSIDWDSIYEGARNFGSGLASFLNGLISPELFGEVGKTIASSLNTALYALNSFGKTFDWKDFGESIASGINNFFSTFDFRNLADTINVWVDGIKTTLVTTIKNIKWSDVIKGAFEFIDELDLDTISIAVGAFAFTHGGKELTASLLQSLLKNKLGIDDTEKFVGTFKAKVGVAMIVALESYKVGNWLYENVESIQKFSDGVAAWIFKDGEEIAIPKTISISLAGLTVSIGAAEIITGIATALTTGTAVTSLKMIGTKMLSHICGGLATVSEVGYAIATAASAIWSALGSAMSSAVSSISALGSTIVSGIGTALSGIGSFLTSSVSTVFAGGAASIAAGLIAAIGAAIGGWKIGQLIYDKFSEQIDSIVFAVGDFFTKTIPQALSKAGKAVVDFVVNVKGNIDEKAQQVKDWFADKKEQCKELLVDVKSKVGSIKDNLANKYNEAKTWISDKVISVSAKVGEFGTDLINKFNSAIGWLRSKALFVPVSVDNFVSKVQSMWNNVKNWWKNAKLNLPVSIGNFVTAAVNAWNRLKNWWSRNVRLKIPELKFKVSFSVPSGKIQKAVVKALSLKGWPKLSFYANGGFPEDGWFRANHGEIMGRFDNGQSVVANNNQITEGISAAVQRGNQQMISYMQQEISELRTQNQLLTELLNKEVGISYSDVGKASQKYAREYTNRTGKPAYI